LSKIAFSPNASGTGTFTVAAPNTNTDYTLTLPTNTGTILTNATAGTVLQVVSTTKTDTFSSVVDETWTDITGLSVSITPSNANSKILVFSTVQGSLFRPAENAILFRLMRDSTAISIGDSDGNRGRTSLGSAKVSNDSVASASINFLDSPNTTSSITYKIQFWQDTPANPIYINRTVTDSDSAALQRTVSVITLMEIAG
jgi:hypothetical protein